MSVLVRERARVIAEQNDCFRQHLLDKLCLWEGRPLVGRVVCTPRVADLRSDQFAEVLHRVQSFDASNRSGDRYQEHDRGSLEVSTEDGPVRLIWRIDCYDRSYLAASPDAANPLQTRRVLTIMLSSEH